MLVLVVGGERQSQRNRQFSVNYQFKLFIEGV
jgi:hypothetical protein